MSLVSSLMVAAGLSSAIMHVRTSRLASGVAYHAIPSSHLPRRRTPATPARRHAHASVMVMPASRHSVYALEWLLCPLLCMAAVLAASTPGAAITVSDTADSADPQVLLPAQYLGPPRLSYNNGIRTASGRGWSDPSLWGGSMLNLVENGMREPINVIVSAASDPYILSDGGFRDYARSIGYSFECFNLHIGAPMRADLGDGNGMTPERFEYRQVSKWDAGRLVGSCRESITGGNHFRGKPPQHNKRLVF